MTHSPLPWRIVLGEWCSVIDADGRCVIRNIRRANAELIVMAVNHHQELMAVAAGLDFASGDFIDQRQCDREIARLRVAAAAVIDKVKAAVARVPGADSL